MYTDVALFLAEKYGKKGVSTVYPKTLNKEILPGYEPGRIDLPSQKRDELNRKLESMQSEGYVLLKRDKRERAFTLYTVFMTDRMELLCREYGIMTAKACSDGIVSALGGFRPVSEEVSGWTEDQLRLAAEGKPDRKFWHSMDVFRDAAAAVKMADAAVTNTEPVYIRDISKRILGNSKAFSGRVRGKTEAVLKACSAPDIMEAFEYRKKRLGDRASILDLYGIMQTPQLIPAYGSLEIDTPCGTVVSSHMPYVFVSDCLKRYGKIRVRTPRFITIENKTTYADFDTGGEFTKFFTGGFPGYAEKEILSRIYEENPDVEYYHWGDIDCGGFRIFDNIRRYLPSLKPYNMDADMLLRSASYTEPLTDNDRDMLSKVKSGCFAALAAYMLENNVKLEQESFYA